MPEGDAVWRTARRLDAALAGKMLTTTDFRVPRLATVDLRGEVVHGTATRGKHLLTRIGERWTLHTHLKMEGTWATPGPGRRWPRPAHTARVVLHTDDAEAVGFSLGTVELLRREDEADALGHLGPDLLGDDWNGAEAVRRLREHAGETLFDALRDQRNLAGLGTIWAAETCFSIGVHPATPVARVPDLTRVVRMAQLKLRQAIGPRAPLLAVYGREKASCRRCGTPVQRLETADGRPIYLCPHCQPRR
jgi:endonuclease-8